MRRFICNAALALAMFLPSGAMAAGDEGLYDPAPPPGSAFIRFLRDNSSSGSVPVKANGKIFDYLDFKEVSSYFVIPHGEVKAEIGALSSNFPAEEGKFYTVILGDNNKLDVKTDPVNNNLAKAQIILYNLSGEGDISLKTSDGKIDIIPSLASGQVSEKKINPVKVSMAVYKDGKIVKDLGVQSLDRSQSYSVVVIDGNNVSWVRSTTNTVR